MSRYPCVNIKGLSVLHARCASLVGSKLNIEASCPSNFFITPEMGPHVVPVHDRRRAGGTLGFVRLAGPAGFKDPLALLVSTGPVDDGVTGRRSLSAVY